MSEVEDGQGCTALQSPWEKYHIDSRPECFDVDAAWRYLSTEAYWGRYRTREIFDLQVKKAFLLFGLFVVQPDGTRRMIGMARIVGDGDTNLLADVFIEKEHQGGGLGVRFLEVVLNAQGRSEWRWLLHTGDRRDWYVNKLGFRVVGLGGRGAMLGMPNYILERDGKAIQYEASQKALQGTTDSISTVSPRDGL